MNKTLYRFLDTIWKFLKGVGILFLFLIIISAPFILTDNWLHRIIIIALIVIGIVIWGFFFGEEREGRYFLIIPLDLEHALALFQKSLSEKGLTVSRVFNVKDLTWLREKTRSDCRVYDFYNVSEQCTIISEHVLQDELRNRIDVFFSDEIKAMSEIFSVPLYYIAEEHSLYVYEIYHRGQQEKRLAIDTHGPDLELTESGEVVGQQEIKQRDCFSIEDYIEGLGFPLKIHKRNIRRVVKASPRKERWVFCKQ